MAQENTINIGIVCGEHSGDRLGAGIIQEIKKVSNVNLYGVGGPKLEKLGVDSIFDFSEINIMGIIEPLKKYWKIRKHRNDLINLFIEKKIDLFIGIDSPDFNMGIHKALKNNNKNIQVVSPSVWVWRENRIKSIKAFIDLTICLFSFEDSYYKKVNHNSIHLGHPFSKLVKSDRKEVLNKFNLDDKNKFISILPGSRKSEIENMLPLYIDFIKDHSKKNKEYIYLIPGADNETIQLIKNLIPDLDLPIIIKQNATKEFLSISDFSIATSGTVTLESAILGCPPIICYKTNFINYSIISRMMKINKIGLPNILLNKSYYRELLQNECNLPNIKNAVKDISELVRESEKNAELLKGILEGKGFRDTAMQIIAL